MSLLAAAKWGSLVAGCGLLTAGASGCTALALGCVSFRRLYLQAWDTGSEAVVHGLRYLAAYGIFLDQDGTCVIGRFLTTR